MALAIEKPATLEPAADLDRRALESSGEHANRAGAIFFGAALLVALLLCMGSRTDPDLPWHLWAGRTLAAQRAVPRVDSLTWTMAGKPWVDFEWGSQLLFAAAEWGAGAKGLWLLKVLLGFGLTLEFSALLLLWETPPAICGLAAVAFAAALFPLAGLRPELFSMAFCLLELHLLERRRLGLLKIDDFRFAAIHAAMYCLWANLHAGFAVGLLLCWSYGLGALLDRRERELAPVFAGACFGALWGTLANPYGAGVYGVLMDHWRHLDALHHLIVEWRLPTLSKSYLESYWLVLVYSFAGFLFAIARRRDVPGTHWFTAAVFAYFASRSVRTTSYAMLVLFPLAVCEWNRLALPARMRRFTFAAAIFVIGAVVCRSVFVPDAGPFLERPEPIAEQGPAGAVEFLRREKGTLAKLRLYNPYNWGGYLGYMLSPGYKTFIDGRYLFVDLLSSVDAADRSPGDWRRFIAERRIELVVQENTALMLQYPWDTGGHPYVAYFWPRSEWALIYWDSQSIVLVRRASVPPLWLASHEYRWLRPHDLRQLGDYVVGGRVSVDEVAREIARYRREIGDPDELHELTAWFARFEKTQRL